MKVSPATASVTIDGADVVVDEGVAVASVPGGTHRVLARAPGFADADSAVGVGAGAVVDVAVELVPVTAPSTMTQGPWLVGAGIGVVAVTAVAVGGLLAWGQGPYLACYGDDPPAGCAVDGEITQTANTTAWAAMATGVVGGLVGGGAIVFGVVGE